MLRPTVARSIEMGNRTPAQADGEPRTLLLVEDNPTDIFVIGELLEKSGLNPTLQIANNGYEALQYLEDLVPSCKSSRTHLWGGPSACAGLPAPLFCDANFCKLVLAKGEYPSCPALVLLDLNLPKVAGIEVLRHLRNSTPCSRTPVIVVTSSTAEADRTAVERLGADAYFQKPTSLTAYMELTQLIRRFLGALEEGPD